jgi:hypothetical protein
MPGRARLRVPKPRTPARVRTMAGRVRRSHRVRDVTVNTATGGLLVSFAPDDPIDLIVEDLRSLGIEILSALNEPATPVRTQSTGAAVVRNVMARANAKLHMTTRGHVDLRLAVPAIYLLLASRNFMRQRGRLRDASWYQLLYWAFDSFFKLHEVSTVEGGPRTGGRRID